MHSNALGKAKRNSSCVALHFEYLCKMPQWLWHWHWCSSSSHWFKAASGLSASGPSASAKSPASTSLSPKTSALVLRECVALWWKGPTWFIYLFIYLSPLLLIYDWHTALYKFVYSIITWPTPWNEFEKFESVSCSVVSSSLQPYGLAHQAPLSMEFCRQKYWNG